MQESGFRRGQVLAAAVLGLAVPTTAAAQVSRDVVVGVTPTCPYGIAACGTGAREGLLRVEGVRLVANTPDKYNCTFDVRLEAGALPDLDRWRRQFKAVVGDAFGFRGVEVTVTGALSERDGALTLRADGLKEPITLAPFEHKLQWNFRAGTAREPEPAEAEAYKRLKAAYRKAAGRPEKVELTGPLRAGTRGPVVEVREYFLSKDP
jgi:galactose oxidase